VEICYQLEKTISLDFIYWNITKFDKKKVRKWRFDWYKCDFYGCQGLMRILTKQPLELLNVRDIGNNDKLPHSFYS
jgi:hypothetical protein